MNDKSLFDLRERLRRFTEERDWDKFHSPKNLAMALTAEVGELVEQFQWLTEDQSKILSEPIHKQVEEEIADIFIYLVMLADKLNIDLIDVAYRKIDINMSKYPVELVRGSAKKYTEYQAE